MDNINMDEINKINSDFNLENMNTNTNSNNLSATLNQGLQFKKYQHKIMTNKQTEEIANDLEKSETSGIRGFYKLSDDPSNVVEGFANADADDLESQLAKLSALKTKYDNLVQQLKAEQQKLLNSTSSYVDQINSTKNPYLGKNVTTKNNGKTYYITEEGVAKLYTSDSDYKNIIGKNNCPETTQEIDSMPTYINTTSGTPMVVGQQCGNEGKNVFVNKMISDTGSTFIGCYNDSFTSPAMTKMNNGEQKFDWASCRQAAIDTGNLYFGLQNLNPTTNNSSCYVSNDFNKSTKYKASTTACQGDNDGYIYGAKSVNAIYKTSETTNPDTTYVGVFKDAPNRTMNVINNGARTFTYETCKKEAVKRNNKFFGLQYVNTKTNRAQCYVEDDYDKISKYGVSTASYKGSDNKKYGGAWTNAVYQINTKKSDYIGCYNDNESSPSMTNLGNNATNYSFQTCQEEAINSGKQYFALQGGKMGSSKCFVSDDLTEAQKYGIYKPCIESTIDKNTYGVSGNNAIYKMNRAGNLSYMGKMGYINGNSQLLEYPSHMIRPGNNYSKYVGYDTHSKTLKTINNTSYTACVDECNKSNEYYGFVFDNSIQTCYFKGKDILDPSLKIPTPNTDLYIRDLKINGADVSCNKSIVDITSNRWGSYGKTNNYMSENTKCGLSSALSGENTKIAHLKNKIGKIGNKIVIMLNNLQKQNNDVKSKIGTNSEKIDADLKNYNKVMVDIQKYKKGETNMDNIVKDTNLLVLYQNYNYMFWSILAISTMIVSMKMMGK